MPAMSSVHALNPTVGEAIDGHVSNLQATNNVTNATARALEVVCAWPVSGQYGPGSRILYYVLISACVLARKAEWIKNACLAAALLLPAVASLHAIVLAAFHQDGAVDLDIYGAFQLCAIGILAAPVTVRLSRTYFYDPGRNTIFLWAGLILAGLLSLTVEFYRAQTVPCTMNGQGGPLSPDPNDFPYDAQPACNMICTADTGPQSPMRGGAANNKYVIPAPNKLTFGAGTLLCAACCVYAILWLASMMDKILEINWKSRFRIDEETCNEPIEGTNGATIGSMYLVNKTVRLFMSVAVVPVLTSAGFAVLVVGEINFFSEQMRYQNEPMASIGQWGPIVGTGLAVAGSLYMLLAADIEATMRGTSASDKDGDGLCEDHHEDESAGSRHMRRAPSSRGSMKKNGGRQVMTSPQADRHDTMFSSTWGSPPSSVGEFTHEEEVLPGISEDGGKRLSQRTSKQSTTSSARHEAASCGESRSRKIVADTFTAFGLALNAATDDSFDLSKFRDGEALEFPVIPGEEGRNIKLALIKEVYRKRLEEDGTPAVQASRSRASSFNGHGPSGHALDSLQQWRDTSSRSRRATSLSESEPSRPRTTTSPGPSGPQDPHPMSSAPASAELSRGRPRRRRDTLEVPDVAHLYYHQGSSPS